MLELQERAGAKPGSVGRQRAPVHPGKAPETSHWWQCVLAKNISSDLEGTVSCSWGSG